MYNNYEPGHTPGLSLIRMQDELSSLLGGRKVDLVTPKFLNRRIREKVIAEARVVYIDLPRLAPGLEAIIPPES